HFTCIKYRVGLYVLRTNFEADVQRVTTIHRRDDGRGRAGVQTLYLLDAVQEGTYAVYQVFIGRVSRRYVRSDQADTQVITTSTFETSHGIHERLERAGRTVTLAGHVTFRHTGQTERRFHCTI